VGDELDPRSEAHTEKRDRKRAKRSKALMRTGLAKTFHTIREIQRKRAEEVVERRAKERAKSPARKRTDD
jgi:hypothetical protein